MPQQHRTFVREEIYPSYIVNMVFSALSTYAEGFKIERVNDTTIRVPASAGDGLVAVAVDGNLRWRESTVQAAHPGGAAGTYDIYVTATANDIDNSPLPNTDLTDYDFGLVIVAGGATPTIVPGAVDHHRKVGELAWDGAKITQITQLVDEALVPHAPTHAPGGTDKVDGLAAIGLIGDRPDPDDPAAPRVYIVEDENYRIDITDGTDWIEGIGGGGAMVSAYLESDAAAGISTGQSAFGTTFAALNDVDGSPSQFTLPEDGAYEFEIQLAGDLSSTGLSLFARVRRVSDGVIVFSRGWNDIDREIAQGTGAASTHVMGAGVESTADPRVRRRVQLAAGTVLELDVRTSGGTLTPNRDLTNVTADKKADTGGATPS